MAAGLQPRPASVHGHGFQEGCRALLKLQPFSESASKYSGLALSRTQGLLASFFDFGRFFKYSTHFISVTPYITTSKLVLSSATVGRFWPIVPWQS
jgi:hypothetical protein